MTAVIRLPCLLIGVSQVACVPMPCRCFTPAIMGRVASTGNDKPIVGAVVTETGSKPRHAVTGDDGTFLLPERKVWLVLFPPQEPWYLKRIYVSVSADGYKPSEAWVDTWEGIVVNDRQRRPQALPESIKLEPAAR